MRSHGLSFADAVQLLGGDSPLIDRLGRIAGVGAAAVTVGSAGTVDFFALRDEVAGWGQSAVRAWREKVSGLGRFDRTERIAAAHTVLVVVAFFEALDEWLAARGRDLAEARLTAAEQTAIAAGTAPAAGEAGVVALLVGYPAAAPSPRLPFEEFVRTLDGYYRTAAEKALEFLTGLRAFEQLAVAPNHAAEIAGVAGRRYAAAYRRLAAEIPEFRLWSEMTDAQATRLMIREALAERRRPDDALDAVRSGLVRSYRARLDRPILRAADAPAGLVLPTLTEGYIEPRGRVATAGPEDLPATEQWWANTPNVAVPDVHAFTLAHLTNPEATDRPLVVLGQPGSGKSVFTRRLAARLTEADFLPVLVELRTVSSDAPVQSQIEQALYLQLGEHVSWPDLARRAGSALPVVMMDGFDELLQATGQNWADYLEQLRDFQQREQELGRPLAMLVTSRTVVADRARFPAGTAVVRLEPFDDRQIEAWLTVWNGRNAGEFAARGLRPLALDAVLARRELAEQPLLLLLLALYDGQANRLQALGGGLGQTELYERLFQDFFERQVDKTDPGRSDEQRAAAVQVEWRRLAAVAVAMHNRGRDVITDAELNTDLPLLLSETDRQTGTHSRPLTPAQMLVGRFFFVHGSQASTDTGVVARSYEFLHATFGEYLGARQIVGALTELAEDSAYLRRRSRSGLDAGFFHALTSFVSIARRAPLWEFCRAMIERLDPEARAACRGLVLELLADAGFPQPTWSLAGYEPVRRTQASRQAAFSANLVSLAVLLADGPVDVAELVGEPVAVNWRRQALLWMGQLDNADSRRLWQALRVWWDLDAEPTHLMVRVEDGGEVSVVASLPWPTEDRPPAVEAADREAWDVSVRAEGATGRLLRKSAFAQTGMDTRELIHALIPFWRERGDITFARRGAFLDSDARVLSELFLSAQRDAAQQDADRPAAYRENLIAAVFAVTGARRDVHGITSSREFWGPRAAAGLPVGEPAAGGLTGQQATADELDGARDLLATLLDSTPGPDGEDSQP